MCECAHYSQNYAGIIGTSLYTTLAVVYTLVGCNGKLKVVVTIHCLPPPPLTGWGDSTDGCSQCDVVKVLLASGADVTAISGKVGGREREGEGGRERGREGGRGRGSGGKEEGKWEGRREVGGGRKGRRKEGKGSGGEGDSEGEGEGGREGGREGRREGGKEGGREVRGKKNRRERGMGLTVHT